MTVVKNILAGLAIGVANIIPGVSGGTIMVILNMFDKIIGAISGFTKAVKQNALFLLQLLVGAGLGIVLFSKAIVYMLDYYPVITNFFFIGLIVGSVPFILRQAFEAEVEAEGKAHKKMPYFSSGLAFLVAFVLLVVVALVQVEEGVGPNLGTLQIHLGMMVARCGRYDYPWRKRFICDGAAWDILNCRRGNLDDLPAGWCHLDAADSSGGHSHRTWNYRGPVSLF